MDKMTLNRRDTLGMLATGSATLMAAGTASAAAPSAKGRVPGGFVTKVDVKNPIWNRDTYVRLDADLDPTKEKVGHISGLVYGLRDNEKLRPLFRCEGFSIVRTRRLEDGSWRRLLREVVFYRDIETGKLLDTWANPYSGETVKVVPIANDPFNYTISEFYPDPPSYGGLIKDKPPRRPLLLDWEQGPDETLVLRTGVDLYYPSSLQPDAWPRESAGVMNRVSEHFTYTMKRADVENPALTHIPHIGAWSRITPWLPWMMMGNAPGCLNYFCTFASEPRGVAGLPADLVAAVRALDEKFLHAPTQDYGPSLSSLENYARFNHPSPVPTGWSPPQPPPAPRPLAKKPA